MIKKFQKLKAICPAALLHLVLYGWLLSIIGMSTVTSPAGNILPSSTESPTSASEEAFFFRFLGVLIKLSFIQLRCSEESCHKHDQIDS